MKLLNNSNATLKTNSRIAVLYDKAITNIELTTGSTRDRLTSEKINESIDNFINLFGTNLVKNYLEEDEDYITKGETFFKVRLKKDSKQSKEYYYNILDEDEIILVKAMTKYGSKYVMNVYSYNFKTRDNDIKNALIKNKIHPIIALSIIHARDYKDEGLELYKFFQIPKKNKKEMRDIYEPRDKFKNDMKDLNRLLQAYFNTKQNNKKTNQFAYVNNRNIVDNAKVHMNNNTVVKLDISKFFESIRKEYIERYIKFICRDEELRDEFFTYIINPKTKGLYMGNPISGTLSNILMYKISKTLETIFHHKNMEVSIYSDDITVSSNGKISKEAVISIVEYAFNKNDLDFKLKKEKTKKVSKQNRRICGITINGDNKITVPRHNYEKARVLLYKLDKGEEIDMDFNTLIGKLNFYKYVDTTGKFDRLFNKYSEILETIGFNNKKSEV